MEKLSVYVHFVYFAKLKHLKTTESTLLNPKVAIVFGAFFENFPESTFGGFLLFHFIIFTNCINLLLKLSMCNTFSRKT